MIEKMNLVYVVSTEDKKDEMLLSLRDLGVLHISEKKNADEKKTKRFSDLQKILLELKDYESADNNEEKVLTDKEFQLLFANTRKTLDKKAALEDMKSAELLEIDRIREWGDFSPHDLEKLHSHGLDFHFYRIDKKELKKLKSDVDYVMLSPIDKMNVIAVLGTLDGSVSALEFELPSKSISELEGEIKVIDSEIEESIRILKKSASCLKNYRIQLLKAENDCEYSAVGNTVEGKDGIVWLKGYIPQSETEKFKECAKKNNWAYQYETVEVDDGLVPTKVKYNKLTALMEPIFDILGTVPGYGEYDISFWFLAFFTLFFAMIVGDAGYGFLFLAAAVVLKVKKKKFDNATLLLFVLSIATIIWGAMTGTWFGAEKAMEIPLLKSLVVPCFSNYPEYFGWESTDVQNSVMKFCFTIGVIQLSLACLMNIRRKIVDKDLSMLADLGWLLAICALYFLVLFLVINQPVNLTAVGITVGVGFMLVVLFGGMAPGKSFADGLKSGLADSFTTFLNTISAFGNVMSYIRLFAVGMASLAIAQSFNSMASGFSGALVVVAVIILALGHAMNIVMGLLSVVVHGVRLNLLEFSGQLGMEWSGKAYEPFKLKKNKKEL